MRTKPRCLGDKDWLEPVLRQVDVDRRTSVDIFAAMGRIVAPGIEAAVFDARQTFQKDIVSQQLVRRCLFKDFVLYF